MFVQSFPACRNFVRNKVVSKGCIAYICAHKPLKEKRK